ncbi:MAG TPA: hypothetical protein PLD23_02345 [Armatimonadota bacterium]|nr:hypothetical protein [Armatimonadota bacterium]
MRYHRSLVCEHEGQKRSRTHCEHRTTPAQARGSMAYPDNTINIALLAAADMA